MSRGPQHDERERLHVVAHDEVQASVSERVGIDRFTVDHQNDTRPTRGTRDFVENPADPRSLHPGERREPAVGEAFLQRTDVAEVGEFGYVGARRRRARVDRSGKESVHVREDPKKKTLVFAEPQLHRGKLGGGAFRQAEVGRDEDAVQRSPSARPA
jgi:hypothetical protein